MDEQDRHIGTLALALATLSLDDDEILDEALRSMDEDDDSVYEADQVREMWFAFGIDALRKLLPNEERLIDAVLWTRATQGVREWDKRLAHLKAMAPADGSWDEGLATAEQQLQDAAQRLMDDAPPKD